jgi:hypothetical protein
MDSVVDSLLAGLAPLIEGPCTIVAAGANDQGLPSLVRARGCRLDATGARLTVYLPAGPGAALLADLRSNGRIAVVVCEPSTHRTVQVKGNDTLVHEVLAADRVRMHDYVEALVKELEPLGTPPHLVRHAMAVGCADFVAASFTIDAVFDQTPGPNAGQVMTAHAWQR